MRARILRVSMALAALASGAVSVTWLASPAPTPTSSLVYHVEGSRARVIRRTMKGVIKEYKGVAQVPVDSMIWNGAGVPYIDGQITIDLDVINDTGLIEAWWSDGAGDWTYRQDFFTHPHHPAGVRIGPSVEETDLVVKDAVTTNVYLHGDTTAGPGVLPTVFTLIASWGLAEVTLDGQPFDNEIDGFPPLWDGHMMTTVGVRNQDGTVRTRTGDIFDMMHQSEGTTDPNDLEIHLTFHDARGPNVPSIPPLFEFFYHVVFEDVQLQISHNDILSE